MAIEITGRDTVFDSLDGLVTRHWVTLALLGWHGYEENGRGFVCVRQDVPTSSSAWEGSVSYSTDIDDLEEDLKDTADLVLSNYNPEEEIIVFFEPLEYEQEIVAFRSQIAPPPDVFELASLPC